MDEILEFLDKAEVAGVNIPSVIGPAVELTADGVPVDTSTHTVAFEARQLKTLFLKLHSC